MTETEKKLECLLEFYTKWAKDPTGMITICPFEMDNSFGQFRKNTCVELCFWFEELQTIDPDFGDWHDCPCEYYGAYGAMARLRLLLIRNDMIKGPRKTCKKRKYGFWHFFFHQWYKPTDRYRKCRTCGKAQYKVYTDSGILSTWFDLEK